MNKIIQPTYELTYNRHAQLEQLLFYVSRETIFFSARNYIQN